MTEIMEASDFVEMLQYPAGVENLLALDPPLKMIALGDVDSIALDHAVSSLAPLPLVVIGLGAEAATLPASAALVDVVVEGDRSGEHLASKIAESPNASVALALLLRGAANRSIAEGLVAESAVYSMLQAGPTFRNWLTARPARRKSTPSGPTVGVNREGDLLHITLSRPDVHNALNTEMREALYEALMVAGSDPSVRVVLDGEGPSFSAGGDLSEFGSLSDPASAHRIRLERSLGRVIATMADRVEVVLHGACFGAGIELPAFAGHVVARSDARLGLPEVALGLIPGAGGTVSVTRRIGRHRTMLLALSGHPIDVQTALEWGLVDEVCDEGTSQIDR